MREPPKALPVTEEERNRYLAPVDRFVLGLRVQNYMVRKRRGDEVTIDLRDPL
jgi:hypothetical protein